MPLVDANQFGLNAPGQLSQSLGRALTGGALLQQAALREPQIQQAEQTQQLQQQAVSGDPAQRQESLQQLMITNPQIFEQTAKSMGLDTQQKKNEAADFAFRLKSVPFEQREQLINERTVKLQSEGRDSTDTESLRGMPQEQQDHALEVVERLALTPKERLVASDEGVKKIKSFAPVTVVKRGPDGKVIDRQLVFPTINQMSGAPEFKQSNLPEGFELATETPEEEREREVVAKIETEKGKAITKQAIAASTKAFEKIPLVEKGILNIDNAIAAIDEGAETGVITKLLPSVRASSQKLDQIQGELGLDVVGSTTFGALSESELAFAKDVALPKGLKPEDLRKWLTEKRRVQQILLTGLREAATFLGQGGTISELVENRAAAREAAPQPPAQQQPTVLRFNPATGRIE